MRYKKSKKLKDKDFKRFYGVHRETFQLMCAEVKAVNSQKTAGRNIDLIVDVTEIMVERPKKTAS